MILSNRTAYTQERKDAASARMKEQVAGWRRDGVKRAPPMLGRKGRVFTPEQREESSERARQQMARQRAARLLKEEQWAAENPGVLPPPKYSVLIKCLHCGQQKLVKKKGKTTAIYCSPYCHKEHQMAQRPKKALQEKKEKSPPTPDVSTPCTVCGTVIVHRAGTLRQVCSAKCRGALSVERMITDNPTKKPGVVEKMSASMQGRTFLARGGNGQLTVPQKLLAERLGCPMEFAIKTAPARGMFPSLPNCYKVDLAIPEACLAIEVDGYTHKSKKWKFLDHRKTSVLSVCGWTVLRFWNEEVLKNIDSVVEKVTSTILRLRTTTTT